MKRDKFAGDEKMPERSPMLSTGPGLTMEDIRIMKKMLDANLAPKLLSMWLMTKGVIDDNHNSNFGIYCI